MVDRNIVIDQEALLSIWAGHFEVQGKAQVSSNCSLKDVVVNVHDMECVSYVEIDDVLDTPFEVEEVEHAFEKFAGPGFVKVINCICELEQIPSCFELGIVIPAFKRKGCDQELLRYHFDFCAS